MGINNLNPFLKPKCPGAYFLMPINVLSGKRVAIDTNLWFYSNKSTAQKVVISDLDVTKEQLNQDFVRKELTDKVIDFVSLWLNFNITPVFIFDGKSRPEKKLTIEDRKDSRESAANKVEFYQEQIQMGNTSVEEDLRKAMKNSVHPTQDDLAYLENLLKAMGIPVLHAMYDGEHLASMLCLDKKVAAVYSRDTDTLAFGCPLTITAKSHRYTRDNYGNKVPYLECIRHDYILQGLNWTQDKFRDLCIMMGCDFNTNINNIAGTRSYNLLVTHGSIDNIPATIDTTCLKYKRCREIFSYQYYDTCIDKEKSPVTVLDCNKNLSGMKALGLRNEEYIIMGAYSNLVSLSSDGYPESLKLASIRDPPKFLTLKLV